MSKRVCVAAAWGAASLGASLLLVLWFLSSSLFHEERITESGPEDAGRREAPNRHLGTGALAERLSRTNLLNRDEIHDRLDLDGGTSQDERAGAPHLRGTGPFLTRNPFEPRYRESYQNLSTLRYPLPDNAQSYEVDERSGTLSFRGQEPVLRWYASLGSNTEVCGVRFVDPACPISPT